MICLSNNHYMAQAKEQEEAAVGSYCGLARVKTHCDAAADSIAEKPG